jgi:excisionase family DNA binding protein
MIDLARERLLTLQVAAERLQVSRATVYGWIYRGASGVKLEAAKVGGHWRTSEEALQRFSDRLTGEQQPQPAATHQPQSPLTPPPRTSRQQEQHQKRVEDQLDEIFGAHKCETCRARIVSPSGAIPKNERVWCPQCLVKRRNATVGNRLRAFRWAAMLSQKELAAQTGISTDNIRTYEYDEKRPTEEQPARFVAALGEELVSGFRG